MGNKQMTVGEQQQISNEVLHALHLIDSYSFVAGGAPRNWKEGKLARDIDLYTLWGSCISNTVALRQIALSRLLGTNIEFICENDSDQAYSIGGSCLSISKTSSFMYKGVLFQIIHIEKSATCDFKKEVLHHMDIGLNRIGWNPWYSSELNTAYILTDEYTEDRDNKTLTVYTGDLSEEQKKHCKHKHLPKMKRYYPDHEVVVTF